MYVCRYPHCKLGGKVKKEEVIKDGRMYFHEECYKKRQIKQELSNFLSLKHMSKRDINTMLKKAIDDIGYDIEYVKYIVYEKQNQIKTPYNILYHLKIKDNYIRFMEKKQLKAQLKIHSKLEEVATTPDQEFIYRPAGKSKYDIY